MVEDPDSRAVWAAENFKMIVVSRVMRLKGGEPIPQIAATLVPLEPMGFNDTMDILYLFSPTRPCFKSIIKWTQLVPIRDVDVLVVVMPAAMEWAMQREKFNLSQPWTTPGGNQQQIMHAGDMICPKYNYNPMIVKLDKESRL